MKPRQWRSCTYREFYSDFSPRIQCGTSRTRTRKHKSFQHTIRIINPSLSFSPPANISHREKENPFHTISIHFSQRNNKRPEVYPCQEMNLFFIILHNKRFRQKKKPSAIKIDDGDKKKYPKSELENENESNFDVGLTKTESVTRRKTAFTGDGKATFGFCRNGWRHLCEDGVVTLVIDLVYGRNAFRLS